MNFGGENELMTSQKDRATRFRQMHHEDLPLVLPNAWDAASARVIGILI